MGVFKFSGVKIVDAPEEAIPKCPYCKKELDEI